MKESFFIIEKRNEIVDICIMNFNTKVTLESDLLIIRPMMEGDFDQLFFVASDPLIWDQHPFPRFDKVEFSDFFTQAIASNSGVIILEKLTGKIIGASRYYNIQHESLYIGYTFLARSHWGGTFNRELKSLMLKHSFESVERVYFDIGECNFRSRRAIEKIGARFIKFQILNGKPYTLYCITKKKDEAVVSET